MQKQKQGNRRASREAALQFLYSHTLNLELSSADLATFWNFRPLAENRRQFATLLVAGVIENRDALDEIIEERLQNYALKRLTKVDLCILRLALFEMTFEPATPRAVCINEALELAKRFSTEDSAAFINGVLDRKPNS